MIENTKTAILNSINEKKVNKLQNAKLKDLDATKNTRHLSKKNYILKRLHVKRYNDIMEQ